MAPVGSPLELVGWHFLGDTVFDGMAPFGGVSLGLASLFRIGFWRSLDVLFWAAWSSKSSWFGLGSQLEPPS